MELFKLYDLTNEKPRWVGTFKSRAEAEQFHSKHFEWDYVIDTEIVGMIKRYDTNIIPKLLHNIFIIVLSIISSIVWCLMLYDFLISK